MILHCQGGGHFQVFVLNRPILPMPLKRSPSDAVEGVEGVGSMENRRGAGSVWGRQALDGRGIVGVGAS